MIYGSEGWGFESLRARPGQTASEMPPSMAGKPGTAAKYRSRASSSAEPVAEPPERGPGYLIRNLGVDLHRDPHAAMAEDRHGNARVDVERGQQ